MQPTTTVSTQEIPGGSPEELRRLPKRSRKCLDWFTICLLLAVWIFLCLICITLLFGAELATLRGSDDGLFATPDEVSLATALDALPVLFCLIFNESLFDRLWRRICYFAIGREGENTTNSRRARNVRAANFNILDFLCRLFKASSREWISAVSYASLRFGTVISIASAQYCVSWIPDTDVYVVDKRYIWIFVPVAIHAISIFAPLLLWRRWPCVYLSDRFCDEGLLRKYRPIMYHIGGSLASYKDVAAALDIMDMMSPVQHMDIRTRVRTGRQISAKLKGVSFGLISMFVPPILAWKLDLSHHVLTLGEYRFIFTLVFNLQNIFYIQALDFVVWNLTLEGFCKARKARPNRTMRYAGYSSGIVLFAKVCKQRRPLRASILLWLFWIQACLMRFLLVFYTLGVHVLSYYSLDDMSDILDPDFWLGWLLITISVSLPLFIIWILMKVDAPVGPVDGWRWAQIANEAIYSDGFYGISNGRASWGRQVDTFAAHEGEEMV